MTSLTRAEVVATTPVKEAEALAAELVTAPDAAIGELVGKTGTGKTSAARHLLLTSMDATKRICAGEAMSMIELKRKVAGRFIDDATPHTRIADVVAERALNYRERHGRRILLIADEANKMQWRHLEWLRYLADECHIALLLVGTDLYERKFKDGRTSELLLQLGRRIGAKRVRFAAMSKAELGAWVLAPRFGKVPTEVINLFWLASRRGNWGDASELANTCQRFMDASSKRVLTKDVVEAAEAWMANRMAVAA